jgi:ketosteroid isomerase-like protein
MTLSDFDELIERYHVALSEWPKGNFAPALKFFSERDDVTLANPFGPAVRGWKQVADTVERAASQYRDGETIGFETTSKYASPELAYIVEVERYKAKIGGSDEITPVTLRVTSIFRREDGGWKLVHRHADPITSARPAESVVMK